MNKNLRSPSKLTEFAPLSPEDNQPRVGFNFSKFFKFSKDAPKENKVSSGTMEAQAPLSSPPVVPETHPTLPTSGSEPFPVDVAEGRSLPNVLKRISNLLALRNNGPRELKKQYWMPDSVSKECYDCSEKFTTFRRRHHCRVCGQIFCWRCCDQEIPGRFMGCAGDLRVCTYCCKVVLSYLQSTDIGAELSADLRALLAGSSPSDAMTVEAMAAAAAAAREVSQLSVGLSSICIDKTSDGYENSSNRRKMSLGYADNFALERASERRCSETASIAAARERTLALQQSASLRTVFEALAESGLSYIHKNRKQRHKITHHLCILGNELIDWLLATDRIGNREQGIAIGQAFVEAAYLEVLDNRPLTFMDDDSAYKLLNTKRRISKSHSGHESHDEPLWVKQIPHQPSSTTDSETEWSGTGESTEDNLGAPEASATNITTPSGSTTGGTKLLPSSGSAFQLDMDFTTNTVQMSRTSPPPQSPQPENSIPHSSSSSGGKCGSESPLDNKDIEEPLSTEFLSGTLRRPRRQHEPRGGWYRAKPAHLSPEHGELEAFTNLFEAYKNHELALCQQLLDQEGLQRAWSEILLSLAHLSVETVRPDMERDDSMDIRQYVKIKKVSGGDRSESQLVAGIVCTKNNTHRGMPRRLSQPTLLLLGCPLVYQHRHEGRLLSLEPVLMQESEYLRHAVNRIVALKPSIVLVQHTVSRLAQDMLLKENISLVLNVKASLLERISRSTDAEIVTSLDAQHVVSIPKLGRCEAIYVRTFQPSDTGSRKGKTLLFLEGCLRPELGCTLLLRGGNENELKRAKRVVKWLMFSAHAWRSELAFLMDIHAWPPPPTGEEDALFHESEKPNEENQTEIIPTIRATCPSRSQSESVSDHSDPLRAAADAEAQGVSLPPPSTPASITESFQDRHRFRQALKGAILSTSPYIRFSVPYLETDIGRRCPLRSYFPEDLYWSRQWESPAPQSNTSSDPDHIPITPFQIRMLPSHSFVKTPIRDPIDSKNVQNSLALFRACGGRIPYEPKKTKQPTNPSTKSSPKSEYPDILSVGTHQRLAVLFCSFSPESVNAPAYCVSPWIVTMDIYGRNDIPLAAFLDRYCFRAEYACPNPTCITPMYAHTRRFIHENGCVLVTLRQLEPPPPPPSNSESTNSSSSILVWTWCTKCNQVSAVVPLSEDARRLSLAKYLELRFHAGNYYTRRGSSPCKHSLFYDHHHFFARGDTVACFKYLGISLWEVSLPPPSLPPPSTGHQTRPLVIDETRRLALLAHDLYSSVADRLAELALQALPDNGIESLRNLLSKERAHFKSNIEDIQLKLTSPTLEAAVSISNNDFTLDRESTWRVDDALVKAKRQLAEAANTWNQRLRQIRPPSGPPKTSAPSSIVASTNEHEDMPSEPPSSSTNLTEPTGGEDSPASPPLPTQSPQVPNELHLFDSAVIGAETLSSPIDIEPQVFRTSEVNQTISEAEHQRGSNKGVKAILSQLLPAAPTNSSSSTSINLLQSYAPLEHHLPVTAAGGSCVPLIIYESEPSSVIAYALASSEYRTAVSGNVSIIQNSETSSATSSPIHKRKMASNSTTSDNLESSQLQGTTINPRSSVLSFLKNNNLTNGSCNNQTVSPNPDTMGSITTGDSNNAEAIDSEVKSNKLGSSSNSSGPSKSLASLHVEVQFNDTSCNFFCRVYFAEQFAQLRASVLPSGAGGLSDEAFIRSLSRCVHWAARGGKSGSTFCKTRDDRFILKAMTTKMELAPFLELAPHYFQYVAKCRAAGAPSLLGKMLGVFRVVYRNTTTGAALKVNLLVMENLFYGREVSHKFDLKGSVRNRLVNPDADIDGELVLLDENLLKMCCETPLYLSSQGKTVLTAAINADTRFLASQAVMDYSLLVGLDQSRKHLVVGIIDYIRTFTWDKRLETMVKSTGILGGQGKLPTVVDPELYRQRFACAMHQYFLSVPDRWTDLSKPLEIPIVIGNDTY